MNENSHPYDPYRNEHGQPGADDQRGAFDAAPVDGAPAQPADDVTPDPYAASGAGGAPAGAAGSYGSAQGAGYGNPQQSGYTGQQQGPAYGAPGAQGAPHSRDVPPAGIKGVYEGPLTGQPTTDSDSRLWAMFSQLSVVLGHAFSWGFLGWVGPLIIFLVYKDRDRFIRYNAAEALNGAIAVVIAQIVLSIVLGIFGFITLGFGFAAFPLVGIPALVQLVFSIIGAVKANKGEWWNYPLNIRLVK